MPSHSNPAPTGINFSRFWRCYDALPCLNNEKFLLVMTIYVERPRRQYKIIYLEVVKREPLWSADYVLPLRCHLENSICSQPQVGKMLLLSTSKSLVITIYDIFIVAFSKLFRGIEHRQTTTARRVGRRN